MQRKVAYVFLYKNGIRERSVGIVRRYGTAEQPEVALELFGEDVRNRKWNIYYFTKGEALAEATYLWGTTTERGRSEARLPQCRLCAEAGIGGGVVLLPEREKWPEKLCGTERANLPEQTEPQTGNSRWPEMTRADLREYLCARYDGKEMTEAELWEAFCRKQEPETGENPRVESAKRLMVEIAKAAGGDATGTQETSSKLQEEVAAVSEEVQNQETKSGQGSEANGKGKRRIRKQIAYLEELLFLKPPYVPCRRYNVEYSVRITPEDLLYLPKEGKRYTENSFVHHGYYLYRHLLLGRRMQKEREDYVLLVPGVYSEKEAGLAEVFGFLEFLPIASMPPETGGAASGNGVFGYFCGKI